MNAIDWDRTTQYTDSVDYVKGLIKLRKQINALRLTDYNDINANVTMLKSADGVVAYQAEQSDGTLRGDLQRQRRQDRDRRLGKRLLPSACSRRQGLLR